MEAGRQTTKESTRHQLLPHQPAHAHPADPGACCNCFSTIVKSKDGRRWCEAGCGEILATLCPDRKEGVW